MDARAGSRAWSLFVDETGAFWEPDRPAALAGLLIAGEGPGLQAELAALSAPAWPGLAYPPHATELRRPAGALRGLMRAGAPHRLIERARAHVAPAALDALTRARAAALFPALEAVDAQLALAPALHAELSAYCRRGAEKTRAALGALAGRAYLVAAIAGPASASEVTAEARYDASLTALLERVLLQLRGGPRTVVRVHVAQLRRKDAVPAPRGRPTMPADVAACIREAEAHTFLPEPADPLRKRVRLVAALPRAYDRNVHPGVVLADFIANHMNVPLRRAQTLGDLRGACDARTRLELSRAPDGLPRAGLLPFPTCADPDLGWGPAWLEEQARLWAAALSAEAQT